MPDNRLRLRRAELGMSQIDAQRAAGISSPTTYWRIEQGFRTASPAERDALSRVMETTEPALWPTPGLDPDVCQKHGPETGS